MASPSSSPRSPKPNNPQKKNAFVGKREEFTKLIERNYSNNSNSPLNSETAGIAGPRPVRIKGTNKFTMGRIRNKKNSRGKRRNSGKKTKRKKRSN